MECMFRIPKDGGKVLWEVTNQCNYGCNYCIFNCRYEKDSNELNTKECFAVIDELKNNGYRYIKITGGEPFIRKDLIEIINYGIESDMIMDISTNASIITDEIITKLKDKSLSMIHISLDGFDKQTQEIIRGNNTFNPTINGIEKLRELAIYLRIGTVIYKENQDHLEKIIKLAVSLNVDEIIFSIMEPVGKMLGNNEFYITKNITFIEQEIQGLKNKYQEIIQVNYNWDSSNINDIDSCPAGDTFLYINSRGNIAPCTWLVTKDNNYLSKSSLKDKNLKDILEDKELKSFMDYKNKNKCGECIANKIGKK